MSTPLVELHDLRKSFGLLEVLHGIELAIERHAFVVLVGPSGCGKSTLLRMIAGLESVTSGTIVMDERVVNRVPAKDRGIAMVFQSYALYPHMTVRENLSFSLDMARMPKALKQERIESAATILYLDTLLDRYPAQLSGGQRQRVAMGRASSGSQDCSCSTNRSRTSMRSSGSRCVPRSRRCTSVSEARRSTSRTTRSKP